jgi:hypothetical protein
MVGRVLGICSRLHFGQIVHAVSVRVVGMRLVAEVSEVLILPFVGKPVAIGVLNLPLFGNELSSRPGSPRFLTQDRERHERKGERSQKQGQASSRHGTAILFPRSWRQLEQVPKEYVHKKFT